MAAPGFQAKRKPPGGRTAAVSISEIRRFAAAIKNYDA